MHDLAGAAGEQTPLDPDEAAQLLRTAVSTRGELDIVEQENVALAMRWAFRRSRNADSLLREPFIRRLHEEMFGRVWRWAGDYRTTDRNLGIAAWSIREEIGRLLGDAQYWIAEGVFDRDELCIRYHHRLVSIHPFPNGNGRHSRLSADLLSVSLGGDPLGWGRGLVLGGTVLRATYIAALQAADRSDLASLIDFGRAR
jgi:Fic-DOC domain mobile mystery protein B